MTLNLHFLFLFLTGFLHEGMQNEKNTEFKMIVEIDNIKHTNAQPVLIAVDKKDNFLKDGMPYRYATIPANSNKITETFTLPAGDYAVSVYQDVNKNGKMDKNFFGAPTEPYAFSRNYKPTIRAPKFNEVKINMNSDRKINISLIQP